jgi:hypothetical protein
MPIGMGGGMVLWVEWRYIEGVLEENENGGFLVAIHMTAHPAGSPFIVASLLILMYSTSSSYRSLFFFTLPKR